METRFGGFSILQLADSGGSQFSRKPPMEKMALRRGSAMRKISPSGCFLIS
jgi:hypothetical protein